jgi:hypothetical protein
MSRTAHRAVDLCTLRFVENDGLRPIVALTLFVFQVYEDSICVLRFGFNFVFIFVFVTMAEIF